MGARKVWKREVVPLGRDSQTASALRKRMWLLTIPTVWENDIFPETVVGTAGLTRNLKRHHTRSHPIQSVLAGSVCIEAMDVDIHRVECLGKVV